MFIILPFVCPFGLPGIIPRDTQKDSRPAYRTGRRASLAGMRKKKNNPDAEHIGIFLIKAKSANGVQKEA
jgi:hypothetical protein